MKSINDYVKDLSHQDVQVRRHAVIQLRYFGPEAAPHLRAVVGKDSDPFVLAGAINSLGWLNDMECVDDLLQVLFQGSEFCAEDAAYVLGELGDESVRERLLEAVRTPGQRNRRHILRAMGAFPGGGVEEALMKTLAEVGKEDIEEAVACAEALAELQYYRAVPEIIELYNDNVVNDDDVADDLISCLAALLGEPRLLTGIGAFEIASIAGPVFDSLFDGEEKSEPATRKAFYNKSSRRLCKLVKEPLMKAAVSTCTEVGILGRNDEISEEELLDKLVETRLGACLYFIDYLRKKGTPEKSNCFGMLRKEQQLVLCAVIAALRELDRLKMEARGELDQVAYLVEELHLRYTSTPRRLIKEVAGFGERAVLPLAERIVTFIETSEGAYPGWCLAETLGLIGTPGAVDGLLGTFSDVEIEEECTTSAFSVQNALARCGVAAVDRIINYIQSLEENGDCVEGGWNYGEEPSVDSGNEHIYDPWPGIFACGALAKIRHPKSFEFLLGRLTHYNEDVRRMTLEQLQEYGDPEAIFMVRRLLDDESEGVAYAARKALVELCDANGIKMEGLDKIRDELDEDHLFEDYFDVLEDEEEWSPDEFSFDYKGNRVVFHDLELKSEPLVKPPKTGRNEPCPCGSGKKYKKCCGKDH